MKHIYFSIAMLAMMTMASCTTTKKTVSLAKFDRTIAEINQKLEMEGYKPSGKSSEQKNEVVVTGQSYSSQAGYGTRMDNNIYTFDTYKFTNNNKTVSYSVKYQVGNGYKDNTTYVDASLIDCNCSDAEEYEEICGDNGIVKKIAKLTPDQTSSFFDAATTYLGIIGGTLCASLLIALIAVY